MKRLRMMMAAIAVFAATIGAATIVRAGETDLMLRAMVRNVAQPSVSSWRKATEQAMGAVLVPCLVRTRDATATIAAIVEAGGDAQAIAGSSILTARLPVDAVAGIARRGEVEVVEAALPLGSKMNTARFYSRVDAVQDGTGLGTAYDGRNVVVGVVDDALDYGNADFQRIGGTRVQYLRQGMGTTLTECTHSQITAGTCAIADDAPGTYHGTNVTGIAASSNSTYTGAAPAADIMFGFNAAVDADTNGSLATAVLDGVSSIFAKADVLDKAAVVNLSLGTSIGAHDGTSLLEQGLTDLSSARAGRIIVNAAGNEQLNPEAFPSTVRPYLGGIHAPITVPAGESRGWRLGIWDGRAAAAAFTGGTLADVWLDAGQKDGCSIATFAYTQGRSTPDFTFPGLATVDNAAFGTADVPFATDTAAPVTAANANVQASIEVNATDPRNAKPHATVLYTPASGATDAQLQGLWYDVVIRSTGAAACSGHMWLYYDFVYYHDFLTKMAGMGHDVGNGATVQGYKLGDGDSQYTATIPSTAVGVISAGSYMPPKPVGNTLSQWTGDDGVTYNQSDLTAPGGTGSVTNDLSDFSSLGPTADGRTRPDIVTPGEPIIATKSRGMPMSDAITVADGTEVKLEGSSMASPHATGVVALLLQRNNTLTLEQVRTAIKTGAHTDGMTPKTPDPVNSYGAGKVDAVAVLSSVTTDTSLYHGTGDLDGGGGGGSSSCTLVGAGGLAGALGLAGLMAAAGLLTLMRSRPRRPS